VPVNKDSVNETDINVLMYCFITHSTTCFDLYDRLQVVTYMYNCRYRIVFE
jgi:hypothetical protein